MKYLRILPDVDLYDLLGGRARKPATETFPDGEPASSTFEKFTMGRVADPRFAANMQTVLQAVSIKTAFVFAREHGRDYVALEDAPWQLLAEVTREPTKFRLDASNAASSVGYDPNLAHNFADYMKAIDKPDLEEPKPSAVALVTDGMEKR